MTKLERVAVVELLRCGADRGSITAAGYAMGLCDGINPCTKIYSIAHDAYDAVPGVLSSSGYHSWPIACLEAAMSVEEGTWPL